MLLLFLSFLLFISSTLVSENQIPEKHIVVISPTYNNSKWYKQNLDSIINQNYTNYHVIYIDDCSSDGTGELVRSYINEQGVESKVTLICNTQRKGAMANWYSAIHSCKDEDIVVNVDGDDWLADNNVLEYINNVYANRNVWMTYGQYKWYPSNNIGFCRDYPESIVKNNAFRTVSYTQPSHLRTFYAKLFKLIKEEDFKKDGKFVSTTCDLAMMWPIIEMAGTHYKFISDILYIYNVVNPLNDFRVASQDQWDTANYIRHKIPYTPLKELFQIN